MEALLSGEGPDQGMDALVGAYLHAGDGTRCHTHLAARRALQSRPLRFTAHLPDTLKAARQQGFVLVAARRGMRPWASVWSTASAGSQPVLMFGDDLERAAAAALVEAFRVSRISIAG